MFRARRQLLAVSVVAIAAIAKKEGNQFLIEGKEFPL